jgi:hypothetical protein
MRIKVSLPIKVFLWIKVSLSELREVPDLTVVQEILKASKVSISQHLAPGDPGLARLWDIETFPTSEKIETSRSRFTP